MIIFGGFRIITSRQILIVRSFLFKDRKILFINFLNDFSFGKLIGVGIGKGGIRKINFLKRIKPKSVGISKFWWSWISIECSVKTRSGLNESGIILGLSLLLILDCLLAGKRDEFLGIVRSRSFRVNILNSLLEGRKLLAKLLFLLLVENPERNDLFSE